MKYIAMIIVAIFMVEANADVKFKVNSSVEKVNGIFKKANISRNGNKLIGFIEVNSMELSKKDKRKDLLEYFDSKKHPLTSFKGEIKNGSIEGTYELKGKLRKMKGSVKGNEATIKIPLTDLVTGFKAMFLGKDDHVEMKLEMK